VASTPTYAGKDGTGTSQWVGLLANSKSSKADGWLGRAAVLADVEAQRRLPRPNAVAGLIGESTTSTANSASDSDTFTPETLGNDLSADPDTPGAQSAPHPHLAVTRGTALGMPFFVSAAASSKAVDVAGLRFRLRSIAEAVFETADAVYSNWNPDSELELIVNAGARPRRGNDGSTGPLSGELGALLRETDRMVRLTQGRFDPTVLPVLREWRRALTAEGRPPDPEDLAAFRHCVGWEKTVSLGETVGPGPGSASNQRATTLAAPNPLTRIDLGGIAKGWAVDRLADALDSLPDVSGYLCEWGGECVARGKHPSGRPWRACVARPPGLAALFSQWTDTTTALEVAGPSDIPSALPPSVKKQTPPSLEAGLAVELQRPLRGAERTEDRAKGPGAIDTLGRERAALATSGDFFQVHRFGYHHIVHPGHRVPLRACEDSVAAATVLGPWGAAADAAATAAIVCGSVERAAALMEDLRAAGEVWAWCLASRSSGLVASGEPFTSIDGSPLPVASRWKGAVGAKGNGGGGGNGAITPRDVRVDVGTPDGAAKASEGKMTAPPSPSAAHLSRPSLASPSVKNAWRALHRARPPHRPFEVEARIGSCAPFQVHTVATASITPLMVTLIAPPRDGHANCVAGCASKGGCSAPGEKVSLRVLSDGTRPVDAEIEGQVAEAVEGPGGAVVVAVQVTRVRGGLDGATVKEQLKALMARQAVPVCLVTWSSLDGGRFAVTASSVRSAPPGIIVFNVQVASLAGTAVRALALPEARCGILYLCGRDRVLAARHVQDPTVRDEEWVELTGHEPRTSAVGNVPLLVHGTGAQVVCQVTRVFRAGDHWVVVAALEQVEAGTERHHRRALLYRDREFVEGDEPDDK